MTRSTCWTGLAAICLGISCAATIDDSPAPASDQAKSDVRPGSKTPPKGGPAAPDQQAASPTVSPEGGELPDRAVEAVKPNSPVAGTLFPVTEKVVALPRLRRLTRTQFLRSVEVVFPTIKADTFAANLPKDLSTSEYDTSLSATRYSKDKIDSYETISDRIAVAVNAQKATEFSCAVGNKDCYLLAAKKKMALAFRGAPPVALTARFDKSFEGTWSAHGEESAIKFAVAYVIGSPYFMFSGSSTFATAPGTVAERLSLSLLNRIPSEAFSAKVKGLDLKNGAQLMRFVDEQMGSPEFTDIFGDFLGQWLTAKAPENLEKDDGSFPAFTNEVKSEARVQFRTFVAKQLSENRNLAALFNGAHDPYSAVLAKGYGASPPAEETESRKGVLTLPLVMAATGGSTDSAPMNRGSVFLNAFYCLAPEVPSGLTIDQTVGMSKGALPTARMKFAAHTKDPQCVTCHKLLDPLAFAFEQFDGVGRFRKSENNSPILTQGILPPNDYDVGAFDSLPQLLTKLPMSQKVQACFVRKAFAYLSGVEDDKPYNQLLGKVYDEFSGSDLKLKSLLSSFIVQTGVSK